MMNTKITHLSLFFVIAATVCLSPIADAPAFDCRKAVTPVEQAICADKTLKNLDAEVDRNFRAAKKKMVRDGVASLVATQRAWLADRDRACASGGKQCILAKYRERNEVLLALLAQTSEENPVIPLTNPAIVTGTWIVSATTDPPTPSGYQVVSAAHLPRPGTRLSAKLGELCIVAPPEARICWDFGLTVVPPRSPALRGKANPAAGSVTLLSFVGGKADFLLHVGPKKELTATFSACSPRATDCRDFTQRWLPASPDADIRILHVF